MNSIKNNKKNNIINLGTKEIKNSDGTITKKGLNYNLKLCGNKCYNPFKKDIYDLGVSYYKDNKIIKEKLFLKENRVNFTFKELLEINLLRNRCYNSNKNKLFIISPNNSIYNKIIIYKMIDNKSCKVAELNLI